MLILPCCYLFLYFSAVIDRSLSMLRFSFPTLTPAVWLNQSDRLWVPGESLSLSAVPFLLKFTLSVTNSFWHLSKMQCSLLDGPLRSLHTQHTSIHTETKSANSTEYTPHMRHEYTRRWMQNGTQLKEYEGTCIYELWLKKQGAHCPPGTDMMPHTLFP